MMQMFCRCTCLVSAGGVDDSRDKHLGQNRKPEMSLHIFQISAEKMCIATRGGFGFTRHILHEWKRLDVERNNSLKLGPRFLAQGGQSGGGVKILSGCLKGRVEESGDMVGIL